MGNVDLRTAVSRRRRLGPIALAYVAFALLGSSAHGGSITVLQYAQINPYDVVTATNSAGVTTLSTTGNSDGAGVSIPVVITNFLGTPGLAIPAFETFVGVTSSGAATSVFGYDGQAFTGKIEFTSGPGGAGVDYLTATFATSGPNANILSGAPGGTSATLSAAQPPASLVLTSAFALLGAPTSEGIGFSNVYPALSISGGSLASFTAQNAGTFSASIVPEPSSIALLGIGLSGLVTVFRFKRSRREDTLLIASSR